MCVSRLLQDENKIFDHNLTAHAIAALRTYGPKGPLFLAVGFKKPHARPSPLDS